MTTPRTLPQWATAAEHRGEWWAPDKPDVRYPGILRFDQREPTLTIEAPPIGQEVFLLGRRATLHGQLDSGRPVTLWDLRQHHLIHAKDQSDDRVMRLHRRFTYAIDGDHLDDYEVATFRYSAVQFFDLGMWSRIVEPVPRGTPLAELPQHDAATLHDPYPGMFGVASTVTITIEYPERVEIDAVFPGGAIMDHPGEYARMVFRCDPPVPAGFHDLLLRDMQELLTFCYQAGAPVLGEWMSVDDPLDVRPIARRDGFRGRQPHHLGGFQMLLTPDDLMFSDLVVAWWRELEELFPTPQVLTRYHHGTRGLLEQSTASAIAAAERTHETIGPTFTRFGRDYMRLRQRELMQAYPGPEFADFRQFLREKLQEDRPILGTKLRELLAAVTPERVADMGLDADTWHRDVKDVRNKLAHTGAHVLRRGDSGEQLDRVNSDTRDVLAMLVLCRLGVDATGLDRAAGVLGANRRMRR
jgi:hypothetical protein